MTFSPNLDILPAPQRALWLELGATPNMFTLYDGTALALRLGHRASLDFDFFANPSFDPDELARKISYIGEAERVQVAPDTLTCGVERGGPVLVSFFGGLRLGQAAPRDKARDTSLHVASLLDIAGTKAAAVQKRAETKDYIDIDAILQHGVDLPRVLAARVVVYGRNFNLLITLKALSFFDDIPAPPSEVRTRLALAVDAVDIAQLPVLTPYVKRPENGMTS